MPMGQALFLGAMNWAVGFPSKMSRMCRWGVIIHLWLQWHLMDLSHLHPQGSQPPGEEWNDYYGNPHLNGRQTNRARVEAVRSMRTRKVHMRTWYMLPLTVIM